MIEEKQKSYKLNYSYTLNTQSSLKVFQNSINQYLINQKEICLSISIQNSNIKTEFYEQIASSFEQLSYQIKKLSITIGEGQLFTGKNSNILLNSLIKLSQLKSLTFIIGYFNKFIFDQAFISWFSELKDLKTLKLIIKNQRIQQINLQDLGKSIALLQQVTKLDLNIFYDTLITQSDAKSLSQGIQNLTLLKKLHLQIGDFNFEQGNSGIIMENIIYLKLLEELKIHISSFNDFQSGLVSLGRSFKYLPSLQKFDLFIGCNNKIDFNGMEEFSLGIQTLLQLKYLSIEIQNQEDFTPKMFQLLGEGLSFLVNLQELILTIEFKNNITNVGVESLSQGISKLVSLVKLDLYIGQENQISHTGSSTLCQSLSELKNLKEFKFLIVGQQLGQIGAISLGNSFQQLKLLEKLELDISFGNQINWKGAQILGKGFQNLSNLIELNFKIDDINLIGKLGMQYIGQGISFLSQLKSFILYIGEYNLVCLESLNLFGEGIQGLKMTETFSIQIQKNNPIESEQSLGIEQQISFLKSIKNLSLTFPIKKISNLASLSKSLKQLSEIKFLTINLLNPLGNTALEELQYQQFARDLGNCKKLIIIDFNSITRNTLSLFKRRVLRLVNI